MSRTILGGLAATVAALAIAAPAHAQEVIPPAQPSTPTGHRPARAAADPDRHPDADAGHPARAAGRRRTRPSASAERARVARSRHGYTYAVCPVQADNVPSGQTVSISYRSSLNTFKPRTNVKWGGTTGTISLSNDSVSGEPSNVTAAFKLAFKDKTVAQVRHELVVGCHRQHAAPAIIQPIAAG